MVAQDYLLFGRLCPKCRVSLFRGPKPIADDIVFCSICGAGGDYEQVVENGGSLISDFVSPEQVKDMMGKMGLRRH